MEPYFAQNKMYIKKDQLVLKDELLLYPRGKHDDLLDGLYYAMKKCYTCHVVETKKINLAAKLLQKAMIKNYLKWELYRY